MRIVRHRLQHSDGTPVDYRASPNRGGQLQHKYLVMHYTAGRNLEGAVQTLIDPNVKVSAHLVIGRDGTIVQLVPFDKVAWHAGRSRWHGLKGLNKYSIGIELDNAGRLELQNGEWRSWFQKVYPAQEVYQAPHKHETVESGWHSYSEKQIETVLQASQVLAKHYGLTDILGHDDIAPGRKSDPGPAFPMESLRGSVLGRRAEADEIFETAVELNIRQGPGVDFDPLNGSPLSAGTRLSLESRDCNWCFVEVLDDNGSASSTGWVYGDYIIPVDE